MTKVTEKPAFIAAKEIMNKSYFNHKPSKYGKDTGRHSINVIILLNGEE